MTNERILKPTKMYFTAVGRIEYTPDGVRMGEQSVNNPDYKYHMIKSVFIENGSKHFITFMGGASSTTQLYAMLKDTNAPLNINVGDRKDPAILDQIADFSFKKIIVGETTYKYLADIDFVEGVSQHIPSGSKIYMSGEITFSEYEGNIQKNFRVSQIKLLQENNTDTNPSEYFNINFSVCLDEKSYNGELVVKQDAQGNNTGFVETALQGKFIQKANKDTFVAIPINISYNFKGTEDTVATLKARGQELFVPAKGKVRTVQFKGKLIQEKSYNNVGSSVIEIDEKMQSLIDQGIIDPVALERQSYADVQFQEKFVATSIPYNIEQQKLAISDEIVTKDDLNNCVSLSSVQKTKSSKGKSAKAPANEYRISDDKNDDLPF